MYRFAISLALATSLAACSSSNKEYNPDQPATDPTGRSFGVIELKGNAPDSTYVQNLKWEENNVALSYTRVSRHVSTADSSIYLDLVADYLPGNLNYIASVARALDQSTLSVRNLAKSNLPESLYEGPDAVENTIAAISNDFSSRVYPELKADTTMMEIAQNGLVNELINFVSPTVLTKSNYTEYYLAGAAHGASNYILTSINRANNQPLTFEQIVKADEMNDVREDLLEVMARDNGFDSEDEYLQYLKDWTGDSKLTENTFPIFNAGLTREGLTVVYPLYSIAPFSSGIQVYTLPYKKIKDDINF